MITDFLFEKVTLEVREICESLNCPYSFNRDLGLIYVYGHLTCQGRLIITANVIESICAVSDVVFNSVHIDSTCRLCALFFIKDVTDGNSD